MTAIARLVLACCSTLSGMAPTSALRAQDTQSSGALTPRPRPQHVVVQTSTSVARVAPGGALTLYLDVAPKAAVHVYAQGAPDVTPVSLVVTSRTGVRLKPVLYPPAEKVLTLGSLVPVNAYKQPFRIAQPVAVSSTMAPGEPVVLAGTLTYQACDDRVCYPAAAVPVRWNFAIQ